MKKLLLASAILTTFNLYCPQPNEIFGASSYQTFEAANTLYNQQQLLWAVVMGDLLRVSDLLSLNVSPNTRNILGQSLLHLAVSTDDIAILNLLLSFGADPNSIDHNWQTPLHYATILNRLDMVRTLLQNPRLHSLPFDQDNFGHAPLFYAQQLNAQEIQNAFQEHEQRLIEGIRE